MTHRASAVAPGAYSGQPACTVQLQLTEGTTTAGMFMISTFVVVPVAIPS